MYAPSRDGSAHGDVHVARLPRRDRHRHLRALQPRVPGHHVIAAGGNPFQLEVPAGVALYRNAARPGDEVWVSGELGGAALALRRPEIDDTAKRLHEPEPRVALGERLRGLAHAAIDVSDGLVGDLQHILERSKVGAVLDYPRIPRARVFARLGDADLERDCVLSGGDDYELVFTAPRQRRAALDSLAAELGLALTRIGEIEAGAARLVVRDAGGAPMAYRGSFDHFRDPP